MKHLKSFNESDKYNLTLKELLIHLQNSLEGMFVITIGGGEMDNYQYLRIEDISDSNFNKYYLDPDDTYIEINADDGTYMDFYLSNFSISKLKEECNEILDRGSDISDDSNTVDKYEFLAQTILVELDKFGKIKRNDDEFVRVAPDWSYVCDTLGVKMSDDTVSRVRRLMDRYDLVKKS